MQYSTSIDKVMAWHETVGKVFFMIYKSFLSSNDRMRRPYPATKLKGITLEPRRVYPALDSLFCCCLQHLSPFRRHSTEQKRHDFVPPAQNSQATPLSILRRPGEERYAHPMALQSLSVCLPIIIPLSRSHISRRIGGR